MKNEKQIFYHIYNKRKGEKEMKIYLMAFHIGFIITLFGLLSGFYHFYKNENYDGYPREIMIMALGIAIMTFSTLLSAI